MSFVSISVSRLLAVSGLISASSSCDKVSRTNEVDAENKVVACLVDDEGLINEGSGRTTLSSASSGPDALCLFFFLIPVKESLGDGPLPSFTTLRANAIAK